MIRIRYRDLPSGVHARAEYAGRSTAIYLRPGLTCAQRKAALRRLRQEARMGCGPSLPCARLVAACAADWACRGTCQLIAIVRLHPVGTLLPVLLLAAMAVLFLHVSASSPTSSAGHGRMARPGEMAAVSSQLAAMMRGRSDGEAHSASMPGMPVLGLRAPQTPSR